MNVHLILTSGHEAVKQHAFLFMRPMSKIASSILVNLPAFQNAFLALL